MEMWMIIVLVVVLLLIIYVIATYNRLVGLRNRVRDQWSQIDVELKRRFDLIPNFVNTVKGYAKHESDTLENVIKARNTYLTADSKEKAMEADGELTSAINKLFALAEAYPDLKANQNFLDLQNQLNETENKISYARKFYNDTALQLNNKIEMFPSNIIAKLFKFTKVEFFKAQEVERENVKVEF
ncbi:MAG: LemA family protein [Bacilli bacterium]|nr:LemA family protein [Bacilli bacterium]